MDQYTANIKQLQLEKAKKALLANNMDACIVNHKEEALQMVKTLLPKGASVSVGGSETLFECGIIHALREMDVCYEDRYREGITREEQLEIYRRAFLCDYYLSSSNAVTMQGELYNVDGNANRVAALTYGPKKVILIVGQNKVVKDLEAAVMRVRQMAAPANCMRLHLDNACTHHGECVDCRSENRICCTYVVHKKQREKNRIMVILVKEDLGY